MLRLCKLFAQWQRSKSESLQPGGGARYCGFAVEMTAAGTPQKNQETVMAITR